MLVNNNPNDYYRTILGSVGTKVHISHPEDYPDPVSGSFTDLLVSQDSEAFVTISPLVIEADDSVKKYPVSKVRKRARFLPFRFFYFNSSSARLLLSG